MSSDSLTSCTIGICDGFNLLLPDNLLADVISAIGIKALDDHEPCLIGRSEWRGLSLPIISAEELLRGRSARIRGSHVAVFHGTEDTSRMPFYGVPLQAAPHTYSISRPDELNVRDDSINLNYCLQKVRVRGVSAVIPDLESLEKRLLDCI